MPYPQLGAVRIPGGITPRGRDGKSDRVRCSSNPCPPPVAGGVSAQSAPSNNRRGPRFSRASLHRPAFCGGGGEGLSCGAQAGRVAPVGAPAGFLPGIHVRARVCVSAAQYVLLGLIRAYRRVWIPLRFSLLGPAPSCRFIPSCSNYASEAIEAHGAIRGGSFALRRLCRCHPWGGFGLDPIPAAKPGYSHSHPHSFSSSL